MFVRRQQILIPLREIMILIVRYYETGLTRFVVQTFALGNQKSRYAPENVLFAQYEKKLSLLFLY